MRHYHRASGFKRSPALAQVRRRHMGNRVTMCFLCVAAFLLLGFTWSRSLAHEASQHYELTVVKQSDTLWDIACRFSRPDQDVRQMVYEIRRANSLSGSVIRPGDVLKIPLATSR